MAATDKQPTFAHTCSLSPQHNQELASSSVSSIATRRRISKALRLTEIDDAHALRVSSPHLRPKTQHKTKTGHGQIWIGISERTTTTTLHRLTLHRTFTCLNASRQDEPLINEPLCAEKQQMSAPESCSKFQPIRMRCSTSFPELLDAVHTTWSVINYVGQSATLERRRCDASGQSFNQF